MIGEFQTLDEATQKIIVATAKEKGGGMGSFVRSNITAMETKEKNNSYTRYVAGILGDCLTKLFVLSGRKSYFYLVKIFTFFVLSF